MANRVRDALAHLERTWRITPPCFTPNDRALDQQERGLIEIEERKGRFWIRLTPRGEALCECEGEA